MYDPMVDLSDRQLSSQASAMHPTTLAYDGNKRGMTCQTLCTKARRKGGQRSHENFRRGGSFLTITRYLVAHKALSNNMQGILHND